LKTPANNRRTVQVARGEKGKGLVTFRGKRFQGNLVEEAGGGPETVVKLQGKQGTLQKVYSLVTDCKVERAESNTQLGVGRGSTRVNQKRRATPPEGQG